MRPISSGRSACSWTTWGPGSAICSGAISAPIRSLDGPKDPQDKGYSEVNLEGGRTIGNRLRAEISIYNLLNTRADNMEYYYTSRLTQDGPEITGPQVHPLEPISARFSLTAMF